MSNIHLETLSQQIWDHVCNNINLILKECDLHGLSGILIVPDPSIENRITALKKLDVVCEMILNSTEAADYSVSRIMYNAKQQILNLEILLTAAKNNDEAGFNSAKACLNGQSKH
ncbi:MAG: hypothetical protein WAX04_10600 [Oscillospiraceae bacterium]